MPGTAPPREQSAQGLASILSPKAVAVIGAGPDPASVGHRLLANILKGGFAGPVHPIHPTAGDVLGRKAYARIQDAPGTIDLAVIAVPARIVMQVVRDCADKGVKGLLVVTAGFRETGEAGTALEQELGRFVRERGMRLVGPNCLGVVNSSPGVRLNAIFADLPLNPGPVALMTQSGALGIALLERAQRTGLGIGRFVSMGNKLDVSGNDLLLHWASDPDVRVIAMHLESVGNPQNFIRIASSLAQTKPLLLVKGGRTPEGARAAGSHTGAMVEADRLVDAMVRRAGAVRVGTVEELFDAALALSLQPLPAGNRVAVVTNSGGPAILLTDALPAAGLRLATLSAATLESCRKRLPADAAVSNPLDMLAGASPTNLTACLQDLLADDGVDTVVAMITPLAADDRPWSEAILKARATRPAKTLIAVLFGRDSQSQGFQTLVRAGVPTYTFPENAARALSAMGQAATAQRKTANATPGAPKRRSLGAHDGWVPLDEAMRVATTLGAKIPGMLSFASPDEAIAAAGRVGLPAALKVVADGLVHKTEAGAVRLNLATPEAVHDAAVVAWERVRAAGYQPRSFTLQQMAPEGLEMIVGAIRDPKFGPVLSVGLGGIHAEAWRDVAVTLAPASPAEVDEALSQLRARRLLDPLRGEPGRDIKALREFAVAVGQFMADNPDVQEFEVNPLRVHPEGQGITAVDARLRLHRAT